MSNAPLQAIVQGEPPTLPDEGYSPVAQDFVRCCLNKSAALRPTYATLLRHPWVADLLTPPTALPDADGATTTVIAPPIRPATENGRPRPPPAIDTCDEEVAAWVKEALDKRKRGVMGKRVKPALHAVALDAVPGSPLLDAPSSLMAGQ